MRFFILFLLIINVSFSASRYGGDLIYATSASVQTLDPASAIDAQSLNVINALYDTLVHSRGSKITPALASSWSVSEDKLQYTFILRGDVYFHKKSYFNHYVKLNAKDVVFSFKRQLDNPHAYHRSSKPFMASCLKLSNIIKDVKRLGQDRVVFTLKHRHGDFLKLLSQPFASILSYQYARYLQKIGKKETLFSNPIGTGAFSFKSSDKSEITLLRNQKYWSKRAYIKTLTFKLIPNSSIRARLLEYGEAHIAENPDFSQLKKLRQKRNIQLIKQKIPNLAYLSFNHRRKPFNDPLVRKAISHAIDQKRIIKEVYHGYAKPALNITPAFINSRKVAGYNYNVKLSKKLLLKADLPNGFTTTLSTLPVGTFYNPNSSKMAQIIKENLSQVGIQVNIVHQTWSEFLQNALKGRYDMILFGYENRSKNLVDFLLSFKRPYANELFGTHNLTFWHNDSFSKLLIDAKAQKYLHLQKKYYKNALKVFAYNAVYKPIASSDVFIVAKKSVHGLSKYRLIKDFTRVWIEKW